MEAENSRRIRGFRCDHCGKEMIPGREIVLNDRKWADLVKNSKSTWTPKQTLLCPECIEELNGGPLEIEDIIHKKEGGLCIGLPVNFWYMRKRGLPMFKCIRDNIRYNSEKKGKFTLGATKTLELWKKCRKNADRIDS
jgi:hypothetical protein